ncbi:alpha-mannosidase [Paenibacillus flagellatus]|uniref:alpha-mannosidase n=1 Tax=Paenibacillus flagellatus TaxID=2211139 RepID=UPI001FE2B3B1|nr:glycoside hydrolase family 38 C-terminal domain-containing protein [Paenibacillus flagellatus]
MPYPNSVNLNRVLDKIRQSVYTPIAELSVEAWVTPEPVGFASRREGRRLELRPGDKWGDLWDCAWFHFQGAVPAEGAGRPVVLLIDINGELCLVDGQGDPTQGLTNVNSEFDKSLGLPGKRVVHVANPARGGEAIDLWGDAGCNDLFGKLQDNGTLKEAFVAICNESMRQLLYDFEVLLELSAQLPEPSARRHRIVHALNRAAKTLVAYDDEEARRARELLAPELAKRGGDPSLRLSAIGHAHIDLAWLWPIRETIRKGARTFATALTMMERYPEYVFGASQPQLYVWMKEHYPRLYARVKERVREGRWEVQGAMWVEPDTNVTGGESLVRQLLYGKSFFRDEFGVDVDCLWLPDVFGYSAALPQLLAKSGVRYMMTTKLSWSEYNEFPHHTFRWEGLDGSRVLVHMPPEGTYNSSAAPRALAKAEAKFKDKAISDEALLLFGIGDGGGGPGEEHLERLRREADLNGLPPVRQEHSARFFGRIGRHAETFPVWQGELYLEKHQGTYTTQADNKAGNRRMEFALRELEWASVLGVVRGTSDYPADRLAAWWKETLLYQFHDILPGSSITRVFDESRERYRVMLADVERLTGETYAALADSLARDEQGGGGAFTCAVFNSLSWERTEWLRLDGEWREVTVPAMGYALVRAGDSPSAPSSSGLSASTSRLENDALRVEFAECGAIRSVVDKRTGRETIAGGKLANRLAVYADNGNAWDFPIDYENYPSAVFALVSSEARIDGPHAVVTQTYEYGQSELVQDIVLTKGCGRIEFRTRVEWRESHKMLRTSFPVAVKAAEASFDIQFGHLKRPTHRNTSWDFAKREKCAHKFADLSRPDFGVALLNDGKYGYRVEDGEIDLNLIRSPSYPDPAADRGTHRFTYALVPHEGSLTDSDVIRQGYELNCPLRVTRLAEQGRGAPAVAERRGGWIDTGADGVIVEAVKRAEDGDGIIVRLYESKGTDATARMTFAVPFRSVVETDLMERDIGAEPLDAESPVLRLRPFDIRTIRCRLR